MSRSSPKTSTRTSDVGCRDYVQMAGLKHAGNRLPALGIRQGHSLGRQREQGVLGLVRLVRDEDTDTPDLSAVAGPCPAR
jgi:hypothetical protein